MLSPHPASFPGRGLCFRVLSCFPPLDFHSSCPPRIFGFQFRLSRPPCSGFSRLPPLDFPGSCPSPDFRVSVPSFPTSLFRFFRLPPLDFPGSCPPRIFGFQFRLSRPPCSGFSGFRLRVFRVSAPLFSCPPPVFPGRGCRPGILNLFSASFFPGRLPASGFSAVFSGTPTTAAHPPRG